jgi:hypothetical protein
VTFQIRMLARSRILIGYLLVLAFDVACCITFQLRAFVVRVCHVVSCDCASWKMNFLTVL